MMGDSDRQVEVYSHGRLVSWWARACWVFALCATMQIPLSAQTFNRLFSFDGADGSTPSAGLMQATNGNLYGTTMFGGANDGDCGIGCGTFFEITPGGTFTLLYSFCALYACADGYSPDGTLVEYTDGTYYGTTGGGGTEYEGTVFKITSGGTLTTVYNFCSEGGTKCTDGISPLAGLILASDGSFYGMTAGGGEHGVGTVFKMSPAGKLTTLYNFCSEGGSECTDGELPGFGELIQASDGSFYGTTADGGGGLSYGGTVFKITSSGQLTTLHSFCLQEGCPDGEDPLSGLVQAENGSLYGTTRYGGANQTCTDGCGTIFKITVSGSFTTVYNFCTRTNCADGEYPYATLIQGNDGNLYGAAGSGGLYGEGTIFKITPAGSLTTIYDFCPKTGCPDGANPSRSLLQDTNGSFYGVAPNDGPNIDGTLFKLSVGLAAFVETQPASGKTGTLVNILGTDLSGATSVTFNGTTATFTVVSPSLITTTVPAGATTGTLQVITPGGTLSSNVPFRVIQ
jgi:uncharacterized repeat protein (TIGR03803 family)